MKLVLDASMALSWLFTRKEVAEAACANRVLSILESTEVLVPSLWYTEIINALLVGERRKVVTEAQVIDYLNRLAGLPIVTDDATIISRRDALIAHAREYALTAYDAAYLELALRNNATLATFDTALIHAMRRAGGSVFCDASQ